MTFDFLAPTPSEVSLQTGQFMDTIEAAEVDFKAEIPVDVNKVFESLELHSVPISDGHEYYPYRWFQSALYKGTPVMTQGGNGNGIRAELDQKLDQFSGAEYRVIQYAQVKGDQDSSVCVNDAGDCVRILAQDAAKIVIHNKPDAFMKRKAVLAYIRYRFNTDIIDFPGIETLLDKYNMMLVPGTDGADTQLIVNATQDSSLFDFIYAVASEDTSTITSIPVHPYDPLVDELVSLVLSGDWSSVKVQELGKFATFTGTVYDEKPWTFGGEGVTNQFGALSVHYPGFAFMREVVYSGMLKSIKSNLAADTNQDRANLTTFPVRSLKEGKITGEYKDQADNYIEKDIAGPDWRNSDNKYDNTCFVVYTNLGGVVLHRHLDSNELTGLGTVSDIAHAQETLCNEHGDNVEEERFADDVEQIKTTDSNLRPLFKDVTYADTGTEAIRIQYGDLLMSSDGKTTDSNSNEVWPSNQYPSGLMRFLNAAQFGGTNFSQWETPYFGIQSNFDIFQPGQIPSIQVRDWKYCLPIKLDTDVLMYKEGDQHKTEPKYHPNFCVYAAIDCLNTDVNGTEVLGLFPETVPRDPDDRAKYESALVELAYGREINERLKQVTPEGSGNSKTWKCNEFGTLRVDTDAHASPSVNTQIEKAIKALFKVEESPEIAIRFSSDKVASYMRKSDLNTINCSVFTGKQTKEILDQCISFGRVKNADGLNGTGTEGYRLALNDGDKVGVTLHLQSVDGQVTTMRIWLKQETVFNSTGPNRDHVVSEPNRNESGSWIATNVPVLGVSGLIAKLEQSLSTEPADIGSIVTAQVALFRDYSVFGAAAAETASLTAEVTARPGIA